MTVFKTLLMTGLSLGCWAAHAAPMPRKGDVPRDVSGAETVGSPEGPVLEQDRVEALRFLESWRRERDARGRSAPPELELPTARRASSSVSSGSEASILRQDGLAPFETTVAEFMAFVEATNYVTDAEREGSGVRCGDDSSRTWRSSDHVDDRYEPVVCLSPPDVRAYLAWRSALEGRVVRLPSADELLSRLRPDGAPFWGSEIQQACRFANLADAKRPHAPGDTVCADTYAGLAPVGSFERGAGALYDLAGNAAELTSTCSVSSVGEQMVQSPATQSACNVWRALGGSYWSSPEEVDPEHPIALETGHLQIDDASPSIGFRVFREPADDGVSTWGEGCDALEQPAGWMRCKKRLTGTGIVVVVGRFFDERGTLRLSIPLWSQESDAFRYSVMDRRVSFRRTAIGQVAEVVTVYSGDPPGWGDSLGEGAAELCQPGGFGQFFPCRAIEKEDGVDATMLWWTPDIAHESEDLGRWSLEYGSDYRVCVASTADRIPSLERVSGARQAASGLPLPLHEMPAARQKCTGSIKMEASEGAVERPRFKACWAASPSDCLEMELRVSDSQEAMN